MSNKSTIFRLLDNPKAYQKLINALKDDYSRNHQLPSSFLRIIYKQIFKKKADSGKIRELKNFITEHKEEVISHIE